MPRISPGLIRLAKRIDRSLPSLLPVCRDLSSARNELRWLQEHARATRSGPLDEQHKLRQFLFRRSKGEPLQYILGSEWFGELEIRCRPGVLIPRQETAAIVSFLVHLLSSRTDRRPLPSRLRLLDLCTGTGCIPLLFHNEFYSVATNDGVDFDAVGVDLSKTALELAQENHALQCSGYVGVDTRASRSLRRMTFLEADILQDESDAVRTTSQSLRRALAHSNDVPRPPKFDMLISNPPYISPKGYWNSTSRSVRRYEPKLALVPDAIQAAETPPSSVVETADNFYPRILAIAESVEAQIVLFEVGDMKQARRVANLVLAKQVWDSVEIWCDNPRSTQERRDRVENGEFLVRGEGHGRAVFGFRGLAAAWLGKT